jgi:hypothetical protein
MRFSYTIIVVVFTGFWAFAQKNTSHKVFNFINHPTSARMTAMGGTLVGLHDKDVTLAWFNPAVLHENMSGQVSFNYDIVFDGIGSGYFGYAQQIKKLGMTFHGGIQMMNYGSFVETDEFSNTLGTFKGQDLGFVIGAARPLSEHWSIGLNLKYLHSALEQYASSAISSDAGAIYQNKAKRFSFGIIAKNAGAQLSSYAGEAKGRLPFELQAGIVKRLKHLPLQYSLTYRNLESWNITYKDPNSVQQTDFLGQPVKQTSKLVQNLDNLGRHLTVGAEFLLGKKENFSIRLGYSHMLKRELSVSPYRSLTGFSYGFGFKVKQFRFDLGRSTTHMAGAMTHFSLSTQMSEFGGKLRGIGK